MSTLLPVIHSSANPHDPDSRFREVSAVIVKVTTRCNLDCKYCYELITNDGDMTITTFESLVDKILKATSRKRVLFLLHGGEPSLMKPDWFERAAAYARNIAQQCGKHVQIAIQSNILALSDSKLELFKQLDIHLSASMDGPPSLPNAMRGLAEKAEKTFYRAQELGLRVGVLMTINDSNWNHFREILKWLDYELGARDFKANVITSVGAGINLPSMSPERIFRASVDILEYMYATDGRVVEENLSLELRRFFAKEGEMIALRNTLCHERQCGAGSTVIGVTPNGHLLPCGRFAWNEARHFLGSLSDDHAEAQEHYHASLSEFHRLVPESWYDCESCEARPICGFGCQAFIVRSKAQANVECIPTKMKYRYFDENRERLQHLATVLSRRENRPEDDTAGPTRYGNSRCYRVRPRNKRYDLVRR